MGRPPKKVSLENIQRFQLELEMAGQDMDQLLKDKKGRSRACLLCQRRKQKCDHKIPSCTACLKAGVKCVQPAKYGYDGSPEGRDSETKAQARTSRSATLHSTDNEGEPVREAEPLPAVAAVDSVDHTRLSELASAASSASCSPTVQVKQNTSNGKKKHKRSHKDGKDDYTLFLEKKLKYLEKLVDMNPETNSFKDKLQKYKKIAHLLDNGEADQDDISSTSPYLAVQLLQHPQQAQQAQQAQAQAQQIHRIRSPILPLPPKSKFLPLHQQSQSQQKNPGIVKPPHSHERALASLASDSLESIDYSRCIFAKYNLKEFLLYDPAFEFDEQLSRAFLDTYFTRSQFKYPLLDEQEIYTFHNDYINNNVHSYSINEFHFSCGRMWLVFSISAHLHKTTKNYQGLPPNRYFSTAIRHITKCGSNLTFVQQVEVLTLLVLYIIRTDRDSIGLYEIIKDVMGICKDKLFLNKWNPQDTSANKKLRLFWSVYLIERMICVAVGKPYTIYESEIDLPLFDKDSFYTRETDLTKHEQGLHFINQTLKLRQIESTFVEELNIIPQNSSSTNINSFNSSTNLNQKKLTATERTKVQSQLPQVKKFFQDLEVWRSNCSDIHIRSFENETLKLYYYRSVRLLLQPYLEFLEPQDRLFKECQAAAGQICQLYKIFHQKTVFGHSTPAVHTVFVAGVTLIYCMWLTRNWDDERRRNLGDESKHTRPLVSALLFSTMDDLRACSVCLYVMAERSKFAIIFRDTFDQLMNATIGNLIERCGPDSSELIYVTNSAMGQTTPTLITIPEKNTEIYETGKDIARKGMPPAVKRKFGQLQDPEQSGFVENSQIDIEEQKERKRRQGVLQKTSVPKSLSHLLVKVEEEDESFQQSRSDNNRKHSSSSTFNVTRHKTVSGDSAIVTPPEQSNGKNQYIVKKPANVTESDWEVFQQQAFLQQHQAQQNLQAYLSSLNGAIDSQITSAGAVSTNELENKTTGAVSSQQQHSLHSMSAHQPSLFSGVDSRSPVHSPTITSPGIWQNNTDIFQRRQSSNYGKTPNTSLHPISFTIDASPRPNDNGIIFNNGTHTMINNISAWTNDSVLDLMNNNHYVDPLGNGGIPSVNGQLQSTATTSDQKTLVVPNRDNNPGTMNPSVNWRNSSFTNINFRQQELHPVQRQQQMQQQQQQHPQTLQRNQNQNQQQLEAMLSVPVEEFWTVNEDYGFLA